MSRAAFVTRSQERTETGMVDACTIRRRTGEAVNPTTGAITPTYAVIYAGKCRVQQSLAQAQEQEPGQATVLMVRLVLQLPMSTTGIAVDDEVTLDTSVHDPDLPGRLFAVRDLFHKTEATARRIGVVERTS